MSGHGYEEESPCTGSLAGRLGCELSSETMPKGLSRVLLVTICFYIGPSHLEIDEQMGGFYTYIRSVVSAHVETMT